MATSSNFIEYVCEQISGASTIRYKKMFVEYMVYVEENRGRKSKGQLNEAA